MALTSGDVIQWTLNGQWGGENVANVYYFQLGTVGSGDVNALNVAEAVWAHLKTAIRGVAVTTWATAFTSISVEQVGVPAGEYGSYAIPVGERSGTRTPGAGGQEAALPIFNAIGVRMNVGSKATRPGQKRLWGLSEADNVGGVLQSAARDAALVLAGFYDDELILGAPALLTTVRFVVRKTAPLDVPSIVQPVTGAFVQNTVRSQVSRRPKAGT